MSHLINCVNRLYANSKGTVLLSDICTQL